MKDCTSSVTREVDARHRQDLCALVERELGRLLGQITLRKMLKQIGRADAEKRGPPRGRPIDPAQLPVGGPTPEEAATLADIIETALAGLPPLCHDVFWFRLQGYTLAEMADDVGREMNVVRDCLKRIGDRLRPLLEEQG